MRGTWPTVAVALLAVSTDAYQTMVVTFDILPPDDAGEEPSAAQLAGQLANAVHDEDSPLHDGAYTIDPASVEVAQQSQPGIDITSASDVSLLAVESLDVTAETLLGRFAEGLDMMAQGGQLQLSGGEMSAFAESDAHLQLGGDLDLAARGALQSCNSQHFSGVKTDKNFSMP